MSTPRYAEFVLGMHTPPPQRLDFSETQRPLEVLAHEGEAAAQERLVAHYHDRKATPRRTAGTSGRRSWAMRRAKNAPAKIWRCWPRA